MSTSVGKKKKDNKDFIAWIAFTLVHATIYAIAYGTIQAYTDNMEIMLGLYFDWEMFFFVIFIAVYGFVTLLIFKKRLLDLADAVM